jgi:hypothetical protein
VEINQRIIEKFHIEATLNSLKYLIIGGFAASFWGKPRFTADIDYVININDFELTKTIMSRLDYGLVFLHPKQAFAHFDSLKDSGFRIDFMIVDNETWKRLDLAKKYADFGGKEKYPVVDPIHLIAMKLHASIQLDRDDFMKDLSDIVEIMLAQNLNFDDLKKAGILDKYESKDELSKLKEFYNSRLARKS